MPLRLSRALSASEHSGKRDKSESLQRQVYIFQSNTYIIQILDNKEVELESFLGKKTLLLLAEIIKDHHLSLSLVSIINDEGRSWGKLLCFWKSLEI